MVLSVDIYDAEDQRTDAAKQEQANQEACAKVQFLLIYQVQISAFVNMAHQILIQYLNK